MSRPQRKHNKEDFSEYLMRLIIYLIFGITGMACIAAAIIAPALDLYYADQAALQKQQDKIDDLKSVFEQREELIANANLPTVVERAAIGTLNYLPQDVSLDDQVPLPSTWPELENALEKIEQKEPPQKSKTQKYAEILTSQPKTRYIIICLGAALILISLTCFNKARS